MSQPKANNKINTKKVSPLPQKIPITYLWFGKSVPEDYLISLSELPYPVIFIKDAELDRKFSRQIMDIQKSDYYRLQYLYEYGGIYSDFDNIIDYPCLMGLLEPYRNQDKVVFMTDGRGRHTRANLKEMTNNLIFAPYPKMPILRKMLDQVNEKKGKIWEFAGMRHVAKYSQPLEVNMNKCVKHIGDWSWFQASNAVLHKNRGPTQKFKNKLSKKIDIMHQNDILEKQIQGQKAANKKLHANFNKLNADYKKLLTDINNMKKSQETNKKASTQTVKMPQTLKVTEQKPQVSQPVESEWTKELLTMQNELQHLSSQNQNLEFERNVSFFAVGGSILLLLILIAIGVKIMRNKKFVFNKVGNSERKIVEQSKLDSR